RRSPGDARSQRGVCVASPRLANWIECTDKEDQMDGSHCANLRRHERSDEGRGCAAFAPRRFTPAPPVVSHSPISPSGASRSLETETKRLARMRSVSGWSARGSAAMRYRLLLIPVLVTALASTAPAGIIFGKKPKTPPEKRVPELVVILKTDGDESKRA